MKRIALVAMLIAAVVAAACVQRNKSTISENTGGNATHADVASQAAASPSPRSGYVTDSANVLDQSSRDQLETTLAGFKQREKIDFAVVTVGSTGNQTAFDYSLDLARERKTNIHDGRDNGGLLLLVAVNDHKWHVQVSRNLEGKLTNEILTTLSKPMTNSFTQKHYGEGTIRYVNAIISKLEERDSSEK